MNELQWIFGASRPAYGGDGNWRRMCRHLLSQLACLGRHTITGLACTAGRQFQDWSADYRLYSKERFQVERMFDVICRRICEDVPQESPLVVALDDSMLRKAGKKIPGVAYRRDPLGPLPSM